MHVLLHCLTLLEPPGIVAAFVAAWAVSVRAWWRRGKTALEP